MSRSYKKNPYVTDHKVKTSKEKKKFANKKVRNHEDVPNGGAFKKYFCSYDICDFKWFYTWEEFKKIWSDYFKNEKEMYKEWYTTYKRK